MRGEVKKADLHVHSRFSERPSQWILKTLGTRESYTDPEFIYTKAKKNGMDFVTITDHNKIDGVLLLKKKYPEDVFMGVEATTYFPEDGCKIHLLLYGFTEEQFVEIDRLRTNIYQLRDYVSAHNIAHSVAHATFNVNGKLGYEHLEKLILLFDVFEAINGARNSYSNHTWFEALENLAPDQMARLQKKHDITPFSSKQPWKKGYTGGSDDHAGLFIGKTYGRCQCHTAEEFVECLKTKQTRAGGRHNRFYDLAFSIYKVAYDFAQDSQLAANRSFINTINELVFQERKWKKGFVLNRLRSDYKKRNEKTKAILLNMFEKTLQNSLLPLEERIEIIYDQLGELSDEYFKSLFESILKDITKIDIINLFRKLSSSFIGLFVALPFLSSIKHMFNSRQLSRQLEQDFIPYKSNQEKKILWFTDTIADLNGVSVTLKKIGWISHLKNKKLLLVSALPEEELSGELPPNLQLLPTMFSFVPQVYDHYTLRIPSILKSIKIIQELQPEKIIISTPGPIGLIGLLAAALLHVETRVVYHTDFTSEFEKILGEGAPISVIEAYLKWFHEQGDKILVPTGEYVNILESRGWDRSKMEVFQRGLDLSHYYYKPSGREFIDTHFNIRKESICLLYTGRISKDKNLDLLLEIYKSVQAKGKQVELIIAGEGPYLPELEERYRQDESIHFVGIVDQKILPYLYSGADLFLFPSTTDTFGMSVLEAQACGLPSLVSDIGGPKEIVLDSKTGFVIKADNQKEWELRVLELIRMLEQDKESYRSFCHNALAMVKERYDWEENINTMFAGVG